MQTMKQVVALALEEAQSGFAALCRRMTDDADQALGEAMRTAPPEAQRLTGQARMFLREQGHALRARMEHAYAGLLVRAMQTMHTDLRTGLHTFRADTLTLIDDEVVTRQIEVERLLLRLRDADELSLGHLNLIIAQIHGESEVRERENPFRPYLLARALYDALHGMVQDEALGKLLFDSLSAAMTAQLGDFYTRLREVFESRGVRSRLVARPSALTRRERERLAWQRAVAGLEDADLAMRQRVARLNDLQQAVAASDEAAQQQQPASALQDLIASLVSQGGVKRLPRGNADGNRLQLDATLRQLQREHAQQAPAAPLALRERLGQSGGAPERMLIDLVALLFEFILHDDLLPAPIRQQLCRLHAPFLRAALQQQATLHDSQHPARRLLDRIGSAASGIRENDAVFPAFAGEVTRLVSQVLQRYEQDDSVFADAERELDGFVSHLLRECDPAVRRCVPVLARAEQAASLLAAAADSLYGLLNPLQVDRRMRDFVTGTWAQVLVHTRGRQPDYSQLLPELVWSAQEKTTPEERNRLMKLLPELGRHLRAGLAAIGMPEAAAQAALDQLLSLHMDVLANKLAPSSGPRRGVAELREHFAQFNMDQLASAEARSDALPGHAQFTAEFALQGMEATVHEAPDALPVQEDDDDWLQWARPGTAFEVLSGDSYLPLRLGAVCTWNAAYLFLPPEQGVPVVYPRDALLAALREGRLRPYEYAPLFERAVESLLTGAESLAVA